jgi:hypothetical protein
MKVQVWSDQAVEAFFLRDRATLEQPDTWVMK